LPVVEEKLIKWKPKIKVIDSADKALDFDGVQASTFAGNNA
jgi:hypothetical protein